MEYDSRHWEQLIGTIIDRIGVERFFDMVRYVLEQRGERPETFARLSAIIERQPMNEAADR
jgi:dissimilatory sulfite reductase (desulfoviridin) alpha/beta subunit